MKMNHIATGNLFTQELTDFIENLSKLKVSADDLDVNISNHKVPDNTWVVTLWTITTNRNLLIDFITSGHLSKWKEKFCFE